MRTCGIRQPPPTNKNISSHFVGVPLQSLPRQQPGLSRGQAGLPQPALKQLQCCK